MKKILTLVAACIAVFAKAQLVITFTPAFVDTLPVVADSLFNKRFSELPLFSTYKVKTSDTSTYLISKKLFQCSHSNTDIVALCVVFIPAHESDFMFVQEILYSRNDSVLGEYTARVWQHNLKVEQEITNWGTQLTDRIPSILFEYYNIPWPSKPKPRIQKKLLQSALPTKESVFILRHQWVFREARFQYQEQCLKFEAHPCLPF